MASQAIADIREKASSGFFEPKSRETVLATNYDPISMQKDEKSGRNWDHDSWLNYGLRALDLFQKTKEGTHEPCWSEVWFREESQFIAGSFSHFHQIWLILIAQMPPENRADLYHTIYTGMCIFNNLSYIRESDPIIHRGTAIGTRFIENPDHVYMQGTRVNKCAFKKKYHKKVLHPVYANGPLKGQNLKFRNPNGLFELHDFVIKQLKKWTITGALELVEKRSPTPLLTSAIIIVPKAGPEMYRVCYDGSPIKKIELFKHPCKLDECKKVLNFLKKGMLMCKIDDKSGFHHMQLDPFSREMAYCQYGGIRFRYKAAAFGIPAVPGVYQTVNSVPVNTLRAAGHHCFLYLDDRIFLIEPKSKSEEQALRRGEIVPHGPYMGLLLMTGAGTYINREKSVLRPCSKMEYLGFGLDTDKGTVRIPARKLEKFKQEAAKLKRGKKCGYKALEKLRGKMCSFGLVVPNMRLYIRRVTAALLTGKSTLSVEMTDDLKEEIDLWIDSKILTKERSWVPEEIVSFEARVYTDASNFAAGIYISSLGIEEYIPWGEQDAVARDNIFVKEAWAVLYCIENYGHLLKNRTIHFLNDNQVVWRTFFIGGRNPGLNRILRRIHEKANELNAQLKISWCSTKEQLADEASRTVDVKEAIFKSDDFAKLQNVLGIHFTLDVFATLNNKKCEKYISLRKEEHAWSMDFFCTNNFNNEIIWAFPPQVVLLQAFRWLQKNARNNVWALVILEYELSCPIWVETRNKAEFSKFDLHKLGNPVLFPAKKADDELGYWRIPERAKCSLLIHKPSSRKRSSPTTP